MIGGQFLDAESAKTFPILDPRTGDKILDVAEADAADVDKAVAAARLAFDEGLWPKMSSSVSSSLYLCCPNPQLACDNHSMNA